MQDILAANKITLPMTPRRPDLRLILNNKSGIDQVFKNPGDHSSKAEVIPAEGDNTAAMIMLVGDTLG